MGDKEEMREKSVLPVFLQREEERKEIPMKSLKDLGITTISIKDGKIQLPSEIISNVEYWEVDPDWHGEIFHSRYQAVRPLRKGDLPSSMILPDAGKKICLRIVLTSGEQIQQVIN